MTCNSQGHMQIPASNHWRLCFMSQKRKRWTALLLISMPFACGALATLLDNNTLWIFFGGLITGVFGFVVLIFEVIGKFYEDKKSNVNKGGRPKGSLSSGELTKGTNIEDILPFLLEAKEAHERKDGSFTKLCNQQKLPESTVRDWLERYKDKITCRET